jgi:hypothetical protein
VEGVANTTLNKNDIIELLNISLSNEKEKRSNFIGLTSFTRSRLLTFKDLVLLIARNMGKSYQRELNDFYKSVQSEDFLIQKVTKGAFSQARAKLSSDVFKNLDQIVVDNFYRGKYDAWASYRLLAIDGSTIQLPNHESVVRDYGIHGFGPNADCEKSLARISMLYDVLNCITVDAQIDAFTTSEKELGERHFSKVRKGDLLIFDRYYASFKLMQDIKEKEADFCFRMKDNWFKEVEKFQNEGLLDKQITFTYQGKEIPTRLIKVVLSETESQILCTSLLSKDFDLEDFKELYHARWGVETNYRYVKNWLELENFSGKTSLSVKQDFYAKVFIMNLTAELTYPIAEQIEKDNNHYKLNKVDAIAATKCLLIPVFYDKNKKDALRKYREILLKAKNKIKPDRHYKRSKKPKTKFSMIYKNL